MSESEKKPVEHALDSWWDGYREKLSAGGTHRVETFIRSHTPAPGTHSRREQLFKTLEQQATENTIEQYDITVLGDELCLCEHCRTLHKDTETLDTVKRLASWRKGGIRASGFVENEVDSSITNEQYSVVIPPEITVGIFVDDTIAGVFPCMVAGANFKPEAYIDGLAAGKLGGILN